MALSQTTKNAISAMSNSDKALALAYILGVDNPTLLADVADAFVRTYWQQYANNNMTNDQKALAMLKSVYEYVRNVYKADKAQQDSEAARLAAIAQADTDTTPGNPLDELPEANV